MQNRAVVIFPDFSNLDIIKKIRNKYDPLSDFIKPHITLVFPFRSELSSIEIERHIQKAINRMVPFELMMKGITANIEPLDNYIFLNIAIGFQEVSKLSKALYSGILKQYQSETYREKYLPHMTIGRLDKTKDYEQVINDIVLVHGETEFLSFVDSVSVVTISDDKAATEMTIRL